MLHNALLQEIQRSIRMFLESHLIQSDELARSRKFMNISAKPDVSPWEVFRAPAGRVVASEESDRPLLAYVQSDRFTGGGGGDIGRYIQQSKDALHHLRGASTARLERAFAEHIDTLSYRLDSWETALFDRRLRGQRQLSSEQRARGVFLGSYGYLENVRPANTEPGSRTTACPRRCARASTISLLIPRMAATSTRRRSTTRRPRRFCAAATSRMRQQRIVKS